MQHGALQQLGAATHWPALPAHLPSLQAEIAGFIRRVPGGTVVISRVDKARWVALALG